MKKENIKILAIETSCDETAAAVISVCHPEQSEGSIFRDSPAKPQNDKTRPVILSSVVSSQIDLHAKTGGVVPEVASRAHMESILPVIQEALARASSIGCHSRENGNLLLVDPRLRGDDGSGKLKTKNYQLTTGELSSITHIAVTAGPGLIGSLLVGFNTAKAMAYALDLPIIPINHIEGHIYSALAEQFPISNFQFPNKSQISNSKSENSNGTMEQWNNELKFPILALTVSGGHTSLTLMLDHGKYKTIGQTRDDAAGEAFDKVAKLLGLGYPGGPVVSKLAEQFRKSQISNLKSQTYNLKTEELKNERTKEQFNNLTIQQSGSLWLPRPMIKDKNFDFSFSGLKTAVLDVVRQIESQNVIASEAKQSIKKIATAKDGLAMTERRKLSNNQKAEICAAFENAAVDVLVTKTLRAAEKYQPKAVILAGGVAANKRLRNELSNRLKTKYYQLILPPAELCGDNAAMIGLAAYYHIVRGNTSSWGKIKVDSNLKL